MKKILLVFISILMLKVIYCYAGYPKIDDCFIFPSNNIWNTPVDTLPVDANSDLYIDTIGSNTGFHADFGSGTWDGGPIGIPFITVKDTQPGVDVTFYYDDESDPGPYPVPPGAPIEGGSASDGDRHVLVIDTDNCILYELYRAYPQPDGSWHADSGAIFDLKSNNLRPAGWTSADAAGLPIFPGLVRCSEVLSGEINHAIRFTAPQTRKAYVWPARHYASSLTGIEYPPMGQRFRLKASFDISGFSQHVQVILRAMKKYGIILADNGSSWYISGAPDERWDNDILRELRNVHGSDFEAVDVLSLMIDQDSGKVKSNQNNPVYHGNDFTGNNKADIAVYRPSNGYWYIRGGPSVRWGIQPGDIPVPGDYNGDGATDIAVYRPSDGYWYIRGVGNYRWGIQPDDIPVPGDYNKDGKTDIGVYRPSNGYWYIRGVGNYQWGIQPGDIPVPGDYNGDNQTDIAIYRPSSGCWYIKGIGNYIWGIEAGDIPVPGDYDGNGTTDIAIYRHSNGYWYIRGGSYIRWGIQAEDIPVQADYNGDGKFEIAVFRPSNGTWYIRGFGNYAWGIKAGDIPVTRGKN